MSAMYPCQGCGAALWEPIDGKWCLACHAIVTTSLPLAPLTDEQVLSLGMDETVKRFAAELIDLHIATGIDLDFWPVAKRFIALAGQMGDDDTAEPCDCGCHLRGAAMPKDAECCECTGYVPEVAEGVFL